MSIFITEAAFKSEPKSWEAVDDAKVGRYRALLAAMQEESQSTQLLKKERENWDVQCELKSTREQVGVRLQECKRKKSAFETKEEELRKEVMKSKQFIRDTDMKIEKAEKKRREEEELCRKKDEEIMQLSAQLQQLEEEKETEKHRISKNYHCKQYLEAVVHGYEEEFQGEIEKLIKRHETLERANDDLRKGSERNQELLDERREELRKRQTQLQNEQLAISSKLHEHQMHLERCRAESSDLENKLNIAMEEKELKESNIGVVTMAIEQIFERIKSTCRLPQRQAQMADQVNTRYGLRMDLVLHCIIERLKELDEIQEEAEAEVLRQQGSRARVVEEEEGHEAWLKNVELVTEKRAEARGGRAANEESHNSGSSLPVSRELVGGNREE
mmetsp:Transcript_25015/g.60653  ORF Transcript_25015/g.60653 Transcript_25015/m.60653 type:complete len:388 (+) Transcript_25015:61-1224(+)